MSILKVLILGILIGVIQSSVLLKNFEFDIFPNLLFVYLFMFSLYTEYPMLVYIFIFGFFGMFIDGFIPKYPVLNLSVFVIIGFLINALKGKMIVSNFFVKIILFLVINTIFVFLKQIFIILYTGYISFSLTELYYLTISNFLALYLFYYIKGIFVWKSSRN